jgi:hypothetical protein
MEFRDRHGASINHLPPYAVGKALEIAVNNRSDED